MRKIIFSILAILLKSISINAQTITISGIVTDATTKEVLVNANITNEDMSSGSNTNTYGFYSLRVPKGDISLHYSHIGYDAKDINFKANKDTTINVELLPKSIEISEVVVSSNINRRVHDGLGTIHVPISIIKRTPAFFGESDLMKSLQYIPGVKNTSEGKSDLSIRGGSPDQNLVLLDGITIYNIGHIFGFLSVFNSEAIKNVTLFKSGFPARFGGRLSSVIDINTKDGNKEKVTGSATLGLLSASFNIEGPIVKDKTSFFLSARRSIIDLYLVPLQNQFNSDDTEKERTNFSFYDINAKLHHNIGEKTSAYIIFYNGRDKLTNKTGNTLVHNTDLGSLSSDEYTSQSNQDWGWGNTILAMRLNSAIKSNMFINATLAYNRYNYQTNVGESYIQNKETNTNKLAYISGIEDYSLDVDYEYVPSNNHFLRAGVKVVSHLFRPEVLKISTTDNDIDITNNTPTNNYKGMEYSAYLEDEWRPTHNLNANFGVRLSSFNIDGKSYNAIDPRISLKYLLSNSVALNADYTQMKQYLHLLTNNSLLLQTDLWLPTTGLVKPMQANQFSIGATFSMPNQLTLSTSTYYKDMNNVIDYKEGASFLGTSESWENKVESGIGRSYGVEIAIEKEFGKTTGTLAYTLSKTERKFDNINFGEWFPAKYDQRHIINAAIMYNHNSKWDFMINWSYSSGNMITLPLMAAITPDIPYYPYRLDELIQLDYRNNYRMPSFHRLDVGANYTPKKKKDKYGVWNFSIYNVYNRKNPFNIYIETDVSRDDNGKVVYTQKLKQVSLFPIMPSVSYTYNF